MTTPSLVAEFRERVNVFVRHYLADYVPAAYRDDYREKVIHDPVWGSNRFHPWEMAILDSPLLQRLRLIKQVGMAHLVYPTARHSRFDHTIGVVSVVSQIANGLNAKAEKTECISRSDEFQLRMAAILHDVGHCLFSHVGERIYDRRKEFRAVKEDLNSQFGVDPKPHEIMSYMIVTSNAFKTFFDELRNNRLVTPKDVAQTLDLDFIALTIIGYWKSRPSVRYQVEVINGPLDADKLDYLARDAYFTGLSVVYDINRYMVTVDRFEEDFKVVGPPLADASTSFALKLPLSGVTALEQILISKMMLYSYMYHHQKVLAAESMLATAFEKFSQGDAVHIGDRDIKHPVDMLYLTDGTVEDLLHQPKRSLMVSFPLLFMLSRRRLVKRALVISRLFVKDLLKEDNRKIKERAILGFWTLQRDLSNPIKARTFRQRLYKRARENIKDDAKKQFFRECFIVVDFPKLPDVHEAINMVVPTTPPGNSKTELLKLFPLKEWAESYGVVQWKGYIFTLQGYRTVVCQAARSLLKEEYGIEVADEAIDQCSIPTSDPDAFPMEIYDQQLSFELVT